MSLRALTMSLFVFGLTGCATVESTKKELAGIESCCKTFQDMQFKQAERAKRFEFEFSKDTKAFEFQTGKSYFVAYEIAKSADRTLLIYSNIIGSKAFDPGRYSQIFCPKIAFLDEEFSVISTQQQVPVETREAQGFVMGVINPAPTSFLSTFAVPTSAKYFVAYADPSTFTSRVRHFIRGAGIVWHPCGPGAQATFEVK